MLYPWVNEDAAYSEDSGYSAQSLTIKVNLGSLFEQTW